MLRAQTELVLHPYGPISRSLAQIAKFSHQQRLQPNPRLPVNTIRTTPSFDSCRDNLFVVREVLTFCVSRKQEHSCFDSFRRSEPWLTPAVHACTNTIKPVHELQVKLDTDAGQCVVMTYYQVYITAT